MIWSDGRQVYSGPGTGDQYVREKDGSWWFEPCCGRRYRIELIFYRDEIPPQEEDIIPVKSMPPLCPLGIVSKYISPIKKIRPQARTSC
jgi:hypothetical protein